MSNQPETVVAVKGFDPNLRCRDFQYAIGETVTHKGEIVLCGGGGFHAVEGHPLEVFKYYPPASNTGELNRFALVECAGEIDRDDEDSKIAVSTLTVKEELGINELVSYTTKWISNRIDITKRESNTGRQSAATNTGNYSVASNTGRQSAATNTGHQSAATNTGNYSVAANTGNYSVATNFGSYSAATNTGEYSAATSGSHWSAATNTGYKSVASNAGYKSVADNTGDHSVATNTGAYAVATNAGNKSAATTTGDYSAATNNGFMSAASVEGAHSVALAAGAESKAKASKGSGFVICFRGIRGELVHLKAFIAGKGKIKPDTWYRLTSEGKPEEVEE